MIISSLKFSERVEGLHPLFATLFNYVKSNDLLNAPLGRIEIDGDNLFINNVEVQGLAADAQVLEMHEAYIDVHILLKGEETIGWKSIDQIEKITKPYSAEAECALSDDKPTSYTTLKEGEFAIVYPEDPHAPIIGTGVIRKLIAKVKL
ncbi:MAG: YhcH/YjgK/YiaL family protein [Rikenellaceae bacterium]